MRQRTAGRAAALGLALGLWWIAPPALAQPYVYPQKGQSPEQQQKDEYECHQWAVQQTGWNPATAATPSQGRDGSLVRGGARGAAVGAVAGAVAGDAGKGAAAGAAGGALIGGMKRRDRARSAQQAQAQGQEAYQRARTACLTGRGYSVN
jgi:hypothetical protein